MATTAKMVEPEILIRSLGEKVRTLRREKNLTQQELGDLSDLSYKYVGEIERAEKNPSIKVLARISNALNVDLIDLISFDLPVELQGEKGSSGYEVNRKRSLDKINRLLRDRDLPELEMTGKILRILFEGPA